MAQRNEVLQIVWACLSSWFYGFHLSELNFPQASLTCSGEGLRASVSFLPTCLGINGSLYGFVTAVFTAGGLVGSLASSTLIGKYGMKQSITLTGWTNVFGVACMFLAPHWALLALGRFISGLGSGLAVCLIPPFLSKVASRSPTLRSQSGKVGTLHQLAIVIGICCAQCAGLGLTGSKGEVPGSWRWVVLISGVVACLQILGGLVLPIDRSVDRQDAEAARVSHFTDDEESQQSPLLPPERSTPQNSAEQLSLKSVLSSPALRPPALLCATIFIAQQASGVNAVLFYSAKILTSVLPASAGVISVGITVVNAVMTFPPIFLVDKVGRKRLLMTSMLGMCVLSFVIGFAIDDGWKIVSSVAIGLFIALFAIGAGPIPFLLVSELVPASAIPVVSSLSLSLSWITNFIVAVSFLPLRDLLSNDGGGEGRVFYVFGAILAAAALGIGRAYRG